MRHGGRFLGRHQRFDAIVIGSGQGGVPLATALAAKGEKTAIIEMDAIGGTCVNSGCTPTKTLIASARNAFQVSRSAHYGVSGIPQTYTVDMIRVRERKRDIVTMFRAGSERRVADAANLTLVRGTASFLDSRSVSVRGADGDASIIRADRIYINTGTRPAIPPIEGLESVSFLTNSSIMELDAVPEHLIVVGGGYIGVEFAQMFRRFGARVTIVHHGSALLSREDRDMSDELAAILQAEGIEVILEAEPVSVISGPNITLDLRGAGGNRNITGTHLLLAAGRRPNSDLLRLDAAGIGVDRRGNIIVNDRLETTAEGIWALGDVKGGPAFTHISYDDYRIIMRNLYGDGKGTTSGRMVPYTVFTDPQIGRIGNTEEEARASGRNIVIAKLPMDWVARALELDETKGFMKAVVDVESGMILGFSMIGIDAGEVAGAMQIAMMGKLSYTELRDATFSHPTLIESLNNLFSTLPEPLPR